MISPPDTVYCCTPYLSVLHIIMLCFEYLLPVENKKEQDRI